jgi:hypothetical protein
MERKRLYFLLNIYKHLKFREKGKLQLQPFPNQVSHPLRVELVSNPEL